MRNISFTIVALALCVLSFNASATTPVPPSGNQNYTQVGIAKATNVEAGSSITPGSRTIGQSMSDAFNVHTLVAGERSQYIEPLFRRTSIKPGGAVSV